MLENQKAKWLLSAAWIVLALTVIVCIVFAANGAADSATIPAESLFL